VSGPAQPAGPPPLSTAGREQARHALRHLSRHAAGAIAGLELAGAARDRLVEVIDALAAQLQGVRRRVTAAAVERELDELTLWAQQCGLEDLDVDELIHDLLSRQASDINNGGLESQIRYLIESCGAGHAREMLQDCLPEIGGNTPA
jgi:hypothetical protein